MYIIDCTLKDDGTPCPEYAPDTTSESLCQRLADSGLDADEWAEHIERVREEGAGYYEHGNIESDYRVVTMRQHREKVLVYELFGINDATLSPTNEQRRAQQRAVWKHLRV